MRRGTPHETARTRIALVNDDELIVEGLHALLRPYSDVLQFVELQVGESVHEPVDVALYDSFAMGVRGWTVLDQLVQDPHVSATIVYTTHLPSECEHDVLQRGAQGVLSKSAGAQEIVEAVRAVAEGKSLHSEGQADVESGPGNWPGKSHGLSEREAETLALICQGLSNVEVAERLIVTLNTVKTYIRSSYRKIGVSTRAEAVLWGSQHGFASDSIPLPRLRGAKESSAPRDTPSRRGAEPA